MPLPIPPGISVTTPDSFAKIRNKEPPCQRQASGLSLLSSGAFAGASASLQYPACHSFHQAGGNIQPQAERQTGRRPAPDLLGWTSCFLVLDESACKKIGCRAASPHHTPCYESDSTTHSSAYSHLAALIHV